MFTSPAHPLSSLPLTPAGRVESTLGDLPASPIRTLTEGLTAGDETAFERFHALYFERLYHLLLAICRGQEDQAQEALQQTLLRVLRYAKPFDSETVFWCWLTNLARSAAKDGGRKRQRYRDMLERFAKSWLRPAEDIVAEPEPVQSLEALLREAVAELPSADRALVSGKYLQGATVSELAQGTGLTEKAVEARLGRLRRLLRDRVFQKLRVP